MATRSIVVAAGRLVGRPSHVIFECPLGYTTILKSGYAQQDSAAAENLFFYVARPASPIVYIAMFPGLASGDQAEWQGWVVLEPHDQLGLEFATGPVRYWFSGALLPGVG